MSLPNLVRLLPLLAVLMFFSAAGAQEPEQAFGFRLTEWNQSLSTIGIEAEAGDLGAGRARALRKRLAEIRTEAQKAIADLETALQPLRTRLDALGPAPAEGDPPEASDIAVQRQSTADEIASLEGQIKNAGLAITSANDLEAKIAASQRKRTIEAILQPFPYPLAPETIAKAIPEFMRHLGTITASPLLWWQGLTQAQREDVVLYRVVLVLVLAIALGWALRKLLLRSFGRDSAITEPTYSRRVVAAIAEGLANGMIPALIFGGLLVRTLQKSDLVTGLFSDVVIAFSVAMILIILARALARAALAPDLPAWRLEDFSPGNARTLTRIVTLLAAVFAVDVFFLLALEGLGVSLEFESFYELITTGAEATLVIALLRGRLWHLEAAPDEENDEQAAAASSASDRRFWALLRALTSLLAVAAVVAALLRYTNLAASLINNLVISGGVIALLYLIRGMAREAIGALLRTDFAQGTLVPRHPTRNLIKFWARAGLDFVILVIGVVVLLPVWGVPPEEMLRWISQALQGFTIGNVTISLTDIIAALIVFVVVILLTRMLQRVMTERVLPQTTLDIGVQNSLSAGLGYVGMIIAGALAVSTLGLDLSNLALIAGALSVGIGFGLQGVVNNFVSGLILLAERPIKVGDWIVVSGFEGTVKRINVRATELETFQRASVMIPNSELVSTSVINWTHKNKLGRIEIPIGVAYGTDVEHVMQVLEECLRAEQKILDWPEPYVLFRGFGDSSLDFEARGYIADVGYLVLISSSLRVSFVKALNEHGIEIPFPQRDIHLKDIDRLAEALGGKAAPNKKEAKPTPAPQPQAKRPRAQTRAETEQQASDADQAGPDGED